MLSLQLHNYTNISAYLSSHENYGTFPGNDLKRLKSRKHVIYQIAWIEVLTHGIIDARISIRCYAHVVRMCIIVCILTVRGRRCFAAMKIRLKGTESLLANLRRY